MSSPAAMSEFAQRLRTQSWRDMAKYAWLILLGMAMLKLAVPAGFKSSVRQLVVIGPLLPFITKDLAHGPDALARLRAAFAARAPRKMLTACWPPELLGLLRVGAAIRRGFVNWLLRRAPPPLPAGEAIPYLERGAYRSGIAIALIAILVELPLDAALMPLFVKDAHKLHLLHALFALGSLSTLVWVLGDRWLIGRGCHVLGDHGLVLRVGARTHGTIALEAIAACRRIDAPIAAWCRSEGVARHKTLLASPLDKPNTVLMLKSNRPVRLYHMGMERSGLDCVFLYVDHPQQLQRALRIDSTE